MVRWGASLERQGEGADRRALSGRSPDPGLCPRAAPHPPPRPEQADHRWPTDLPRCAACQSPGHSRRPRPSRSGAPYPKRFCRSLRLTPGVFEWLGGARPSRPRALEGFPHRRRKKSELAVALADAGGSPSWPRPTRMRLSSAMHRSRQEGEALKRWHLARATLAGGCLLHALMVSDNQQAPCGQRMGLGQEENACEFSSRRQPATSARS
jgi:hypothetical protein